MGAVLAQGNISTPCRSRPTPARIAALYRARGYFNARVTGVTVTRLQEHEVDVRFAPSTRDCP